MTRNENSVYSLQSRCFPCVHKLSVLALNGVDSPPCCLAKCGRGRCGNKREEKSYFSSTTNPPPLPLLASPLTPLSNKLSQHFDVTYRNIIGRNMLCAFGHPVATCGDMLSVPLLAQVSKMVKFNLKMTQFPQQVSLFTCLILVGGGIITVRLNESVVLYVRVISKVISTSFL